MTLGVLQYDEGAGAGYGRESVRAWRLAGSTWVRMRGGFYVVGVPRKNVVYSLCGIISAPGIIKWRGCPDLNRDSPVF